MGPARGGGGERGPREAWEDFLASPWVGTFLVVLGVVTGLLGSIYADELKNIIQSLAPLSSRTGAWIFGACVVVTAAAVFSRQRVIDRRRDRVQKRFDAAATNIPELIRTLPEPSFQGEFGIVFEKTASMLPNLSDLQSRAQGVTVVLQGFAALAGQFDAGRRDDRFVANLMVYLSGNEKNPWMHLLKFFDKDPKDLAGVLVLPADFAALADGSDDQATEFALPVPKAQHLGRPKNEPGGLGWRALPGAPFATSAEHWGS